MSESLSKTAFEKFIADHTPSIFLNAVFRKSYLVHPLFQMFE